MTALLVLSVAAGAFVATMVGGVFALTLGRRLPVILGFSAGAVIGVAFFDLLPEAVTTGLATHDARLILSVSALGFFVYALLDRVMALHDHEMPDVRRGWIGAASFSTHSLLDGLAMGLAFQAGHGVGLVVAAAVLTHDFSDGINTVNLVVRNGGSRKAALRWLVVDAAAPVLGAGLSLLITVSLANLSLLLALFAGFFFYIGACELMPEAARVRPRGWTTLATLLGAGVIFLATSLI